VDPSKTKYPSFHKYHGGPIPLSSHPITFHRLLATQWIPLFELQKANWGNLITYEQVLEALQSPAPAKTL
jgi:hypothetical protein